MRFLLFLCCFIILFPGFSQNRKDTTRVIKIGNAPEYEITKTVSNKKNPNSVILNVTFEPYDDDYPRGIKLKIKDKTIDVKPDAYYKFSYRMQPGKFPLEFTSSGSFPLVTDTILFLKGTEVFITVQMKHQVGRAKPMKPVIYLYPEKKQEVNVQFNFNGITTFTYPIYSENGWQLMAHPNGTLEQNGKEYNYLFWEGDMDASLLHVNTSEGSIVAKNELVTFLENSLASMGLNSKEMQDFITFWVPKMQENELNYVHFLVNENYDRVSTLAVNPEPDNALRVYMVWTACHNKQLAMPLRPQIFSPLKREGFTVIEWGGSEVKNLIKDL